MRYLATVVRKQVFGPQQLQIHSKEIDRYCWVPAQEEITTELANAFKPGTLVVAHITTAHHKIQRLEEASQPLVSVLHGFSTLGRRYKTLEADILSWRESMNLQIAELRRRESELMARAEELNLQLTCSLEPKLQVPSSVDTFQPPEA